MLKTHHQKIHVWKPLPERTRWLALPSFVLFSKKPCISNQAEALNLLQRHGFLRLKNTYYFPLIIIMMPKFTLHKVAFCLRFCACITDSNVWCDQTLSIPSKWSIPFNVQTCMSKSPKQKEILKKKMGKKKIYWFQWHKPLTSAVLSNGSGG